MSEPYTRFQQRPQAVPQGCQQNRPQPRLRETPDRVDSGSASLAAIAREEQARIYSGTVPEHHGNAAPLPAADTAWERARLTRAAHKLRGDA